MTSKIDVKLIAETFIALHDEGILIQFDPRIISIVEKTLGFKERELDNKIDVLIMERLEPRVEYSSTGSYVKVTYNGKIYYFSGKIKCYYREPSYMDSMDAFYSADVIIDVENGHILKSRNHSIVKIFQEFFDAEFGFHYETY